MASHSKSVSLIIIAITLFFILFLAQLQQGNDCDMESGCFYVHAAGHGTYNRKLLSVSEESDKMATGKGMKYGGGAGWELREAPLGPDPLHHHGGSPSRKPIVTP